MVEKRKFGKKSKRKARQPAEKKLEVSQAFAVSTPFKGTTLGSSPRCNKCGFHNNKACWVYTNCSKKGHIDNICKTTPNQGTTIVDSRACYEYKDIGHIRRDCTNLKGRVSNARSIAFGIGAREVVQDPTVVIGTFLINHLYANILFDTSADRSCITPEVRNLLGQP